MAKPNINVLNKLKGQSKKLKAKEIVVKQVENNKEKVITQEERGLILKNYSLDLDIEDQTKSFLEDQTVKIHGVSTKMYNELGEIFSETQKKLSNNKNGVFEKWYLQLGFKKMPVYRLINRWNYIVTKWDNKNLIENLPISLSYEVSNPNCPEKLSEKVLNGEITTLKEFKAEKHLLEDVETPPMLLETFEYTDFSERYKAISKTASKRFEELSESKKMRVERVLEQLEKLLN
ncbi:hypothetical protein NRK67_17015 (plasmid) [Fusobacteria bacterium ZRK30]|nr:hypothetical protein NRK67_17015 [Fusobacteria bacterium ZRK30]